MSSIENERIVVRPHNAREEFDNCVARACHTYERFRVGRTFDRSLFDVSSRESPGAIYQAHAYASLRGSAPALSMPVFGSMTIAAFSPIDHGAPTRSLWPLAMSAARTASGTRDSTDRSPGYIVCGNGDAGKLRVVHRGASIAC